MLLSQYNKQNWGNALTITCITCYDIYLQGFTETTRTPRINITVKEISSEIWYDTELFNSCLLSVFTWYYKTFYCVRPYAAMIGNFYFNGSLNVFFTPLMYFRMTSELIDLGLVTHISLLIRVLSELGTRFCKVEISHLHNKLLRLYDLHRNMFWLLIHKRQAIKIKYIIIWNFVVATCSTVSALYLNKYLFWWRMMSWDIGRNKNNWISQNKNLERNLLHYTFVL